MASPWTRGSEESGWGALIGGAYARRRHEEPLDPRDGISVDRRRRGTQQAHGLDEPGRPQAAEEAIGEGKAEPVVACVGRRGEADEAGAFDLALGRREPQQQVV